MLDRLYHATYLSFLDSIKENGLGATDNKMWEDSKPGVVYLAADPWVAESYAETAELAADELLDNIVIIEIDCSALDKNKLMIDKNVLLDEDEENTTWEYHGIIPWKACKIFNSNIVVEDLHNHSKGYNIIEFSDKVGWDSSARDWARALINTLEDDSIRILDYYEDKNFCDFKVNQHGDIITYRVRPGGQVTIRMHEANSIADEFKLYETLWEQQEDKKETKNTYRVRWITVDRNDNRSDFTKEVIASNEDEAKRLAGIPKNRRYVRDVSVIKV